MFSASVSGGPQSPVVPPPLDLTVSSGYFRSLHEFEHAHTKTYMGIHNLKVAYMIKCKKYTLKNHGKCWVL